jgi:predicted Ser/Thr protein kinase
MKYLKIFEGSESFFGTSNYGDFEINKPAHKVIFNMFICDYESPNWKENVEILKEQVNQFIRTGITDSMEIKSKIKKTYKNRCFLIVSK